MQLKKEQDRFVWKWVAFLMVFLMTMLALSVFLQREARACNPTVQAIQKSIVNYSRWDRKTRVTVARFLAPRILIEAKRWKLSPITMLAIASVESDFRNRYRGRKRPGNRRSSEAGVWQLIPGDSPIRKAEAFLRKCFRTKTAACPADIMARLKRPTRLRVRHLADITLSTWIFAFEVTQHVKSCKARHRHPHRRSFMWGTPRNLGRFGHFNTGPKIPGNWYLSKISKRYRIFKKILCKRPTRVAVVK